MKYTVVWKTSAEAALAEIWMRALDRSAVAQAANKIDDILSTDPHLRGKSHLGESRILFAAPLGIIFRVDEPNRIVRVIAVWWIPAYTTNGSP